jgi:hypothetical protein
MQTSTLRTIRKQLDLPKTQRLELLNLYNTHTMALILIRGLGGLVTYIIKERAALSSIEPSLQTLMVIKHSADNQI